MNLHVVEFLAAAMVSADMKKMLSKNTTGSTSTDDQRFSHHTLCMSIANLNTTLSCMPFYDKVLFCFLYFVMKYNIYNMYSCSARSLLVKQYQFAGVIHH